jgi:hypothetical protein
MGRCRGERGQAAPLLLGVVALFIVALLGLAALATAAADAARARTAADAAALAGVRGGRSAANALAAANGGRLVAFHSGDDVVVVVAVGDAQATARAELAPVAGP